MSLAETIQDTRAIRYCQLAATFLVFYDHLICLDQEVEFIWKRKWTLSKILYIANRWFGQLLLTSECVLYFMSFESTQMYVLSFHPILIRSALFWLQGYLNTAVIWIASTIMTLRVIAMFPQSRVIRYSALLVLVAELIAMLAILSVTLRGTRPTPNYNHGVVACFPFGVSQFFYAFYLPPLILETVLFLLAIWNAVYQLKIRKVWNRNEVLSVLIRDSIFYFFVSELSFAANAGLTLYVFKEGLYLGFRQHRTPWLQIPYSLSATANTILVARLILNLQSAFYKPTFSPTDTLTTIDWVHTANSTSTGAFEMSTSPRIPDFSNVPNSQYFPS